MRFMRVGPPGQERPVMLTADNTAYDLRAVTADINGQFLADRGMTRAIAALTRGKLERVDIRRLRIGPPIQRPGVVLCIGMNYAGHAAETGAPAPAEPVMFYKAPNAVIGPDDDILLPPGSTSCDWEVELAVIIGTRARYLTAADDPLSYVAGYTISNDISERTLQLQRSGGQWSKGKSCETFNPLGPWMATPDEIVDPQLLDLSSWVNGEARQASNTKDMIFGVAELIRDLSQVTVLEPGDVINTGTPEGVALSGHFPYLAEGDLIEMSIDGLGRQRQRVLSGG